MKKFFIIAVLLILSSCIHTIFDNGVVQEVKINKPGDLHSEYRYIVVVGGSDVVTGKIKVYTNTLYSVGDTIKFHKVRR